MAISKKKREKVQSRANSCCEYCKSQDKFSSSSFSIEHIYPQSLGGSDELSNLAWACQGCNNAKFTKVEARDIISNAIVTLFNPRLDKWDEHFKWNQDCSLIIGQTAIGRATVIALKMNRDSVVNLRNILFSCGEHPPL